MSCQRVRPRYRLARFPSFVLLVVLAPSLVMSVGTAQGGDVAFSEASGQLGLGSGQPEAAGGESSHRIAEAGGEMPWLETSAYLVVAFLIFGGYALAARKVPWLRPRRPRKP